MTPATSRPTKKAAAAEPGEAAAGTNGGAPAVDPEIANLSYEDARDALVDVVRRLEGGAETLEESLALWERGEALAQHCENWLAGAQARLEAATPRPAGASDDED